MRLRQTRYLDDDKCFNHGQPTSVIEIEHPDDFDTLLAEMASSGYYDREYLAHHSGQVDDRLISHFWWLAEAVARLSPRRVLEVGCGRGDVLRILREAHGVDVTGIDVGDDAANSVWQSVRPGFRQGDIEAVLREWEGPTFDVVCGFDIWEHLHPARLEATLAEVVRHASPDAWFFFVVPAFGEDEVFGECFPLELEENRTEFEERTPFRFLITEAGTEFPAAGHLTWAHTEWWVAMFERAGLVRHQEVERQLHAMIDPVVPDSVRAFYLFRHPGAPAPGKLAGWAHLPSLVRRWRYSRRSGAAFNVSPGGELNRLGAAGAVDRRLVSAAGAVAAVVRPLRARLRRT